jgi:tRNA 2-thiocytidine biosynthesis protein TtcA
LQKLIDTEDIAKEKKPRISKLEFFFSKKVGEAIAKYHMIDDNDKILVGVSGGKDSMSLLKTLRYKQKSIPVKFDIIACYVDMGFDSNQKIILEDYFKRENYNYTIEETKVWNTKAQKDGNINCFWCAFSRRKKLFETADRLGCNKIALGHHKDDIAETFLLNLFFHGEISTMLPKQVLFNGKFHIIRPLALCEEKFIIDFAKASNFPQVSFKCRNSATSKRMLMKNLLRNLSGVNKDTKTNIFRSMERIRYDYLIR